MTSMTPSQAREYFRALLTNAGELIQDADTLLEQRPARARALVVLAQEELGKAVWVKSAFADAWTEGLTEPRTVDALKSKGTAHLAKYIEGSEYGADLDIFWGDFSDIPGPDEGEDWRDYLDRRNREVGERARAANEAKKRGLYVDFKDGETLAPDNLDTAMVAGELRDVAGAIEMMLIEDHVRMKNGGGEYDSTHETQRLLLPYAHPEMWARFVQDATPDE
ncbi:AbiV family abortive infection protein [Demequina sp. NBRC 110051]|uniref:AbiV family abortive infection protein n=1 Tax=Demequina sp. NBRC 110051 TaxID=1570340 RepID=UPI0009FEF3EB|nr:AbiV family abortive infection protein [Demequina sp. NBRC 110051]